MGFSAKCVPLWLLPDSYLEQANIDPSDRNRVRPNILLVEMTQTESLYYSIPKRPQRLQATMSGQDVPSSSDTTRSANDPGPQRRKVWLIEGGYASDTRYMEKLAQKKLQHQKLLEALALRGFDAQLMIFVFGVGGTIYKQTLTDMKKLGVSAAACTKTLKDIHLHSVKCTVNMITQRRILDGQLRSHLPARFIYSPVCRPHAACLQCRVHAQSYKCFRWYWSI